ncbi:MAG: hypothetical protein HC804_01525 [Anaerolineae bacterium]|nr:hypothetical protein [Anaerolineae bacterium]
MAFSIVGAIVLLITANICAIIWLSANGGSGLETIPILDVIARIPGFVFLLLLPIGIIG